MACAKWPRHRGWAWWWTRQSVPISEEARRWYARHGTGCHWRVHCRRRRLRAAVHGAASPPRPAARRAEGIRRRADYKNWRCDERTAADRPGRGWRSRAAAWFRTFQMRHRLTMRRRLSGSIALKVLATLVAISAFVLLYEATTFDSREAAGEAAAVDPTAPVTGARLQFQATAYCKGKTTASGVGVRSGVAAADPALLPVGTRAQRDDRHHEVQRHLYRDGHRARGAGTHPRSLHVELSRGPGLRSQGCAGHGAATRLESERQLARLDRSPLPSPGGGKACRARRIRNVPCGPVPETTAPRPEPDASPTTAPGPPENGLEGTDSVKDATAIAG